MNDLPILNQDAPPTCGEARQAALTALRGAILEANEDKREIRKRLYRLEQSVKDSLERFKDPESLTAEALKELRIKEAEEIGVVVRADTLPVILPWVLQNLTLLSVLYGGTRAWAVGDYIVTVENKDRASLLRMVEAIEGADKEVSQ